MNPPRARILVVDDEPIKRSILEDQLEAAGYDVDTASNPIEAESLLEADTSARYDVVITDLRMPGKDGIAFLRDLKARRPAQAVIVMTAYGTVDSAVEAMKLGAFDYVQKPFSTEELLLKLDRLLRYENLTSENEALRRQLSTAEREPRIVGRSEPMRRLLERIHAVSGTDSTVLIEGESGTGKELAARAIHHTSHRSAGPFVAVSCAALPADIIEAELFGHEPGAFTGATARRLGRIELAHNGTLFLDDVDDIPPRVQVKLLRVLQDHTFERLGAEERTRVNIRVVAATKTSLARLVKEGSFREDLYYRLNVVPLKVPALRERREDIPLLVQHFLHEKAIRLNRPPARISPRALRRLQSYHWPGNVRQLEHVVEQMLALSEKEVYDLDDVPELTASDGAAGPVTLNLDAVERVNMAALLDDVEARLVRWALDKAGGNIARAAEILNVPRTTLQYKASKHSRQ